MTRCLVIIATVVILAGESLTAAQDKAESRVAYWKGQVMKRNISFGCFLVVLILSGTIRAVDFPQISEQRRTSMLEPPRDRPVRMILDTDTYNEIDDQFAVVYSLISPELDVRALYAAPFKNGRSSGPGDGMRKSYEEIVRLLSRLDKHAKR